MKLIHGECLEEMDKLIEQGVKVDAIITDPPYNITACDWDKLIPFNEMWERLNKLIKPNGAIVLFGSEPFSSALRMSNIKNYKYDWVWEKSIPTGGIAKFRPMKKHENILVFYKLSPIFNPIYEERENSNSRGKGGSYFVNSEHISTIVNVKPEKEKRRPTTVISIKNVPRQKSVHPTQKPVALMEYLIKTYTNEGETVLDFTCGSGTTLVACQNTNRKGIGIELDETYFNISKDRIGVK